MRNLNFILYLSVCISCSQSSGKQNSINNKDTLNQKKSTNYQADTEQLSAFNWAQLKDTTKYDLRYLQLNFLNFPADHTIGQDILGLSDSLNTKSLLLTNRQEFQLYQLINNTANFSEGDCGTFHLNAGIFVLDKDKICGIINIGCGYSQWNFSSENLNAKYGAFNELGFNKMQQLLDDINLSNTK